MLFDFANVLVFFLVGAVFIFASLALGKILRPKAPTPQKLATYECGELPTGNAWVNFNIRFYIVALLFIIFDVEIAFMLPVGVVFKKWIQEGNGVLALAEVGMFVGILLLGLIYAWVKGDLEWAKKVQISDRNEGKDVVSQATKI